MGKYTVAEFCVGGGGQALGLEAAGFECAVAIEIDTDCCTSLRLNRPQWNVLNEDMRIVDGSRWQGVDLFAAGVPCPPFSIAGKQLGKDDDRDLFPDAIRIIGQMKPKAVLLENVPGFAAKKFSDYRDRLQSQLLSIGYKSEYRVIQSSDYGVPQLRPRFILVAMSEGRMANFRWPEPLKKHFTVGDSLRDLMAERGWKGAAKWANAAQQIAPTIVGGSKKHGGPDLGPTRAKIKWKELGVDGIGIANEAPSPSFPVKSHPRLTVRMVARIQGFPDFWKFSGRKTAAYRQVGNAFPPPVAAAIGVAIAKALDGKSTKRKSHRSIRWDSQEQHVPFC